MTVVKISGPCISEQSIEQRNSFTERKRKVLTRGIPQDRAVGSGQMAQKP
jgi:hypothetical protein